MKNYRIGVLILSVLLIISNSFGMINAPEKVSQSNKKVLRDLNLLRVKLHKKKLLPNNIIDKHMVDIAHIPNYENLDSLRKYLKGKWICDYNVKLFKLKANSNSSTFESDIKINYPKLYKSMNDSEYNEVGINVGQNETTVLLVKNYISIDSLSFNGPDISEMDGKTIIPTELFIIIKGKTKINKLYYHTIENSNNVSLIKKENRKTENLDIDNGSFSLKIKQDIYSVAFVDENDIILYIYNLRLL